MFGGVGVDQRMFWVVIHVLWFVLLLIILVCRRKGRNIAWYCPKALKRSESYDLR